MRSRERVSLQADGFRFDVHVNDRIRIVEHQIRTSKAGSLTTARRIIDKLGGRS